MQCLVESLPIKCVYFCDKVEIGFFVVVLPKMFASVQSSGSSVNRGKIYDCFELSKLDNERSSYSVPVLSTTD